jgi:alpha-methylacyl-CoA racemase
MGPLAGVRVIELEAIGPVPFCGMMLADMGADVLLVDRVSDPGLGVDRERWSDLMRRGRRSLTLDLKCSESAQALLMLAERADVLIEGFRPGVIERLGLGPDVLLARNRRIVVGRMTGWGQHGPLAPQAGHDIDYIARSGVLHAIGPKEQPLPPLNVVGDFGGGGMLLAFGVACALLEARKSGHGQVVDAAMIDGASLLATMFHGLAAGGRWSEQRFDNLLDGAAPWYATYRTSDGKFVAVGAIERKFYAAFVQRLGLTGESLPDQYDRAGWPVLRERFAAAFLLRTREEWIRVFESSDACVSPVLTLSEAHADSHASARDAFVDVAGIVQPAPAPRFSRTPGSVRRSPPERGSGGEPALRDWGFSEKEIAVLRAMGVGFDAAGEHRIP